MDKTEHSQLILDAHENLSQGYGYLDNYGNVERNTYMEWSYLRKVRDPIVKLAERYLSKQRFHMLDAGCGNGQLIHVYTELGAASICGVDFGNTMLNLAIERAKNCKINFTHVNAGLEGISNKIDKQFDLINLYGVIEHLTDPLAVLKELEKLLVPNGLLLLMLPRKWSLAYWSYFLFAPSLAKYAGRENLRESILRKKKMNLYHFFTGKEKKQLFSQLPTLRLLDELPVLHGYVVGKVDKPFRKWANNGEYAKLDRWNDICKKIGFVPAGEFILLQKI